MVSKHTEAADYQYWCGEVVDFSCSKASYVFAISTRKVHVLSTGELNTLSDVKQSLYHTHYNPLFNSDSMLQIISFMSYAYTKLIRFLILNSVAGFSSTGQDTWWRFVPDPVAFDHLFTDEELYEKYNLTPDEIAIIEGTIAERPFSTVWSWIPKEYQELALKELNNKI